MEDFDVQFQVAGLLGIVNAARVTGADTVPLDLIAPAIERLAETTGLEQRLAEAREALRGSVPGGES